MRLSARRTILAALVAGGAIVGAAAPALADSDPAAAPTGIGQQDDDDDDDGGRAPVGGVETGQGGTAGGYDLMLPLSLLGGSAATVAGVVLIRRRLAGQTD